jgi:PAS domain S-box-containing protein
LFQEQLEPPHLQHAWSRNEQLYRDLLESFSDGVIIVTPEGLVLDINQCPLADAHLRREEVVGTPLTDLPAWSHDLAVQQRLLAAMAQAARGETVRFEARIHPRPDLSLDILMTITSHRDANQQVEYLICSGRDITERKQAEDQLRTLVDAIPQLVWITRPDGSVTYHNHRLIDYLAMTLEQAEGDGWLAGVHPDDRQRVREVWQTSIQTGVPYEVELSSLVTICMPLLSNSKAMGGVNPCILRTLNGLWLFGIRPSKQVNPLRANIVSEMGKRERIVGF